MRPRASILTLLFVASLTLSTAAGADDADALVREGVELRRQQRDDAALAKFLAAYAIAPTPRVRAQIALAHQALGHFVEAERELSAALLSTDDEWIARNRPFLEQSLARSRARLAWIEIATTPASAEVFINGERLVDRGSPARVIAGTVVVEARASGHATTRRVLDVAAGARVRENIELTAAEPDAPASAPGAPAAGTPPDAHLVAAPSARVEPSSRRTWSIVLGGTALALGAGGALALGLRESAASIYNDDRQCLYGGLSRDARCGDYRADAVRDQWIAIGAFAAAGVAAGAAVWLYVSSPSRPTGASAIRCTPSVGALGVGCAGTF